MVLEGGVAFDWETVQPQVASQTWVCSYDRPDSPQSRIDLTPDRTAQQVVDDLHALLTAVGETGPYALVGHSLGGIWAGSTCSSTPTSMRARSRGWRCSTSRRRSIPRGSSSC